MADYEDPDLLKEGEFTFIRSAFLLSDDPDDYREYTQQRLITSAQDAIKDRLYYLLSRPGENYMANISSPVVRQNGRIFEVSIEVVITKVTIEKGWRYGFGGGDVLGAGGAGVGSNN